MIDGDPMATLRRRSSEKWRAHPDDVLPMFVAEMDYPLAPAIREALTRAIADGDTGYIDGGDRTTAEAFASFARDRWGWSPDAAHIVSTTDVSVVVVESLRRLIEPGDGVVITPPVYPPFYDLVPEAGGTVVEVPLADDGTTWSLDLDGIDRALAAGARAVLLCNPHNPLGLVHSAESLRELSRIVARHGATVVSDEIHAPLTHPAVTFTPYLTVGDEARDHGIAAESGSKAFNLAGLKAALFVTGSERMAAVVGALPDEVRFRTGHLGLIATREGFEHGRDHLDGVLESIGRSFDTLEQDLAERLPAATLRRPAASYLAWLDLRGLGWGDDPAARILADARVALSSGPLFGAQGRGFARMNVACAPATITEAVTRIAAVAGA